MADRYDVIVIGGGPGGYPAAIRAAQNKLSVACIDGWQNRDGSHAFGGTCLNAGCIPSKALLESSELFHRAGHEFKAHGIGVGSLQLDLAAMHKRRTGIVKGMTGGIASLFKSSGVTGLPGHGRLLAASGAGDRQVEYTSLDGSRRTLAAGTVILAAGSVPVELKSVPQDGSRIVDSWGALEFDAVPARLGVIGAGVIGLELGSVWHRLGAKVSSAVVAGDAVNVAYTDAQGSQTITFDKLVVAVGRRPYTKDLLAEGSGVEIDARGFIVVDEHCRTGAPSVFAIGDCVRGPMLAHKAKEEGVMVAELAAGRYGHVDYDIVPSVIYTAPEIAWVGQSEAQARAAGVNVKLGVFPFIASGRARAMESTGGFAKIVADADSDRILGVHIIGPMAGELIAEACLAMEYRASCEDLQRTMHAHPTLSEAVHEAALAADKRAIDTLNR